MKVPHPLRHFDVENLFVVDDVDEATSASVGKRRVVIALDEGSVHR